MANPPVNPLAANVNALGFKDPDGEQEKSSRGSNLDELKSRLNKKKAKYKQYKEKYPRSIQESKEFTLAKRRFESFFISSDQHRKQDRPALASGQTYETSVYAKDDQQRIELFAKPKLIITHPTSAYDVEDITVVEITRSDQFIDNIGHIVANAAYPEVDATRIAGLRSVTSFIPVIPPPNDKNWNDYLEDIRNFGIGTSKTRMKYALGQSTMRAWFTAKQVSLNQNFYCTESEFIRLNPATGDPKNIESIPRIVCFYRKFLDSDYAWDRTVPGGNKTYSEVIPSIDKTNDLMKTYLASPSILKRLIRSRGAQYEAWTRPGGVNPAIHSAHPANRAELVAAWNNAWNLDVTALPGLGTAPDTAARNKLENLICVRAFQNLSLHPDTYEMIKHTMATVWVMLSTVLADFYIFSGGFKSTHTISMAGDDYYPPGIITPQYINALMSDTAFMSVTPLACSDLRASLIKYGEPYGFAMALFRKAFSVVEVGDPDVTRLYKDGFEWINAAAPTYDDNVVLEVNGMIEANKLNFCRLSDQLMRKMSHDAFEVSLSGIPKSLTNDVTIVSQAETEAINAAIQVMVNKYVGPTLDPTGTEFFSNFRSAHDVGLIAGNVLQVADDPSVAYNVRPNIRKKGKLYNPQIRNFSLNRTTAP